MNPLKKIKYIISDFDGVMTDNKVIVCENGIESVVCNRSDGLAVELLKQKGIQVIVISKETNRVVEARCKKIDVEVYQKIDKKIDLLRQIIKDKQIQPDEICYVGNEINDLECMNEVKISIAPADAHQSVLKNASIVTKSKGGEGVIREISDMIL
jgi:YrbI family 3-deoxy-D-manno-octulosonate 8-phosphate phosphatase